MNTNNPHINNYDLQRLAKLTPKLKDYIFVNQYKVETIDFANPEAVKTLNKALIKSYYDIDYWEFSNAHLCPPIPSRVDYLHEINDVLKINKLNDKATVLDIGTGATLIYPLLGQKAFGWNFIATDTDKDSLKNATKIIEKNKLGHAISLRTQDNPAHILQNVLKPEEKVTVAISNPPFYKDEASAIKATQKKWRGLKLDPNTGRNFSGKANELWYDGGEKAFIQNYIYDSSLIKTNVAWFTTLVSDKDLLRPMKVVLKKYEPEQVKVIKMTLGKKTSHMLLWTYLKEDALNSFKL
ncbi:23S rRNA (adenine(1618)-N(6))-methyltransferase RlmF [Aurantibacter aestuarii]|uniref:23S rRNA (Adenine(1618)-N(6))-methyltransferase RlmF n=1 Tax=Aurantibacter aestuarii TaxID=1266046 RepID=A0A2T1NA08_9FLAO|nr:23S rRNA (adenine(1618)-N(6))-methyltransferase RlmF [Aurantibacter aestuarii]PSG88685.1 23S rRNA (adenine(1618)-N(6))-methyltransferase RlmF [Aurantibacter aestuarii]